MTRRMMAGVGAALALALLLPIPASEAQNYRAWRNPNLPGVGNLGPPPPVPGAPALRRLPQVPNYYFDRGGPVVAPQGPVGPGDIASSLRARGFNSIGPVERRGSTSITRAKGPSGEDVQLVIGPNGEIVGVRVLKPGAP